MSGIIELLKILLPIIIPLIGECYALMDSDGRKSLTRLFRNPKNCLRMVDRMVQIHVVKEGQAVDPQVQELLTAIDEDLAA